jgi:hypothetical protein
MTVLESLELALNLAETIRAFSSYAYQEVMELLTLLGLAESTPPESSPDLHATSFKVWDRSRAFKQQIYRCRHQYW